ncbi:uracil/xanthine transporter [Bacillus sp. FJAT-50079]|uniref:uracil/xanthine transporter n=1 Tax=Bacillus sp. FJAT-50079 TaxID=2833577 RepID=UPI001BCA4909|nr:uracil/xanthine transporter [Bacillus sp. FJAT-50079]MBS4210001.1 uracil/xanthine transporter [Bacillus sp. FJAT-50079]
MSELLKINNWIAGLQWLFFIFTNTVVIPITVGAAFQLSQGQIVVLIQLSFFVTGLACIIQTVLGHKRAVMEGQSGLWWGVILSLCYSASAQGISLSTLGGSLAVGVILSGMITIIIGLSGVGQYISKLFSAGVMGVFMFLFGCQLISIFLKGMLGIPFGGQTDTAQIDLPIFFLSVVITAIVIIFSIKAPPKLSRYALLVGIIVGWLLFVLIFDPKAATQELTGAKIPLFPLGSPAWNIGIILTAIFTGLLNLANTFGALKGTEAMYHVKTSKHQYRRAITISGVFVIIAGLFGMVPYAPYVASIGFLSQSRIIERLPLILGGFLFVLMGMIPPVGHFFSTLPLSVGSAVLFVAYLQLLHSSFQFFRQIELNTTNIYRSAIPLFVGIIIMTLPPAYFESIPSLIRPLLSSGLLVGIMLALILENCFSWERRPIKVIEKKDQSAM